MTKPNVVLILTDDQNAKTLWHMGRPTGSSVYAALIKAGTTFLNSFVVCPQCGPSRASLLTGQYPHNHGYYSNASAAPHNYQSLNETELLPVALQNAGYVTSLCGKYVNGHTLSDPIPVGWNDWHETVGGDYYNFQLNDNGAINSYSDDYLTDRVTAKAAEFINSRAGNDTPFFVSLGLPAPHAPFQAALKYKGKFGEAPAPRYPGWNAGDVSTKPAYVQAFNKFATISPSPVTWLNEVYRSQMESLMSVDEAIETVVGALAAAGKSQNTYIIFTSDNGTMGGEWRMPFNKVVPYEPSIEVPLIIAGPGVPVELTRSEIVSTLDVTHTIMDIAGAVPLSPLDGKSLLPLLATRAPVEFREYLLIEFMEDFMHGYPVPGTGQPAHILRAYSGLRGNRWKYISYNATGESEFYDLASDPYEQVNSTNASVKQSLAAMLAGVRSCVGNTCL